MLCFYYKSGFYYNEWVSNPNIIIEVFKINLLKTKILIIINDLYLFFK